MSSIKDRFQDEKNFQVRGKSDLTWCQLKYNFKERVVYSWYMYECVDTIGEPAVAIKSRLSPSKTIKIHQKIRFYKKNKDTWNLEILKSNLPRFQCPERIDSNIWFSVVALKILATGSEIPLWISVAPNEKSDPRSF